MKKHWISYSANRQSSPMTFWVHVKTEGAAQDGAPIHAPPLPGPIPGNGYAVYFVEFDDALLWFSSLAEISVCIDTLSQKLLPSNLVLTRARGENYGPSNHWLNRIPLRSMAWAYRLRVVKYLKVALADFESDAECAFEPGAVVAPKGCDFRWPLAT